MGRKVLAAKSGRAVCSCAAAGGGIAAKNAKSAESLTQRHKGTEKMKSSGNPWIGDVPEGWEVRRLKSIFEYRKGLSITKADLTQTGIPVISYGQIHSKENTGTHLQDSLLRFVPLKYLESDGNCLLKEYDFVFADTSEDLEGLGNCVYVDRQDKIFAGYHTIIFRPYGHYRGEVKFRYLAYLFKTDVWRSQFRAKAFGIKVYSLSQRLLNDCYLILPPLPVQRAIASYLDEKCGAIDEAIVEAKKGIEEYKAWKKSLIFEVVTGKRRVGFFNAESKCARDEVVGLPERSEPEGLQGAARHRGAEKMKPSGIPWIGTIPEGWKVSRVKNECDCLDYLREPISAENRVNEKALYDYYGASGAIDKIDDFNVDDTVLLIGEDGANLRMRNLPLVYRASGKIWVNNHAHILKVKPSNDYGFMAYALEAGDYNDFVTGSAQPKLTQTDLMAMPVVLPSLSKQQAIADHLDEKCAAIDAMVAEKEALIADLEAYKKSLIYETVTGKREVA